MCSQLSSRDTFRIESLREICQQIHVVIFAHKKARNCEIGKMCASKNCKRSKFNRSRKKLIKGTGMERKDRGRTDFIINTKNLE